MLQDKRAGEEGEEGGNRLGQIGHVKGQHRGSPVGHRGIVPPLSRDSSAAGEGADPECGNGGGAEACSRAWSRGAAPTNQPLSCEASPNQEFTLACTAKSASGTAGGFIGRQPVTPVSPQAYKRVLVSLQTVTEPALMAANRRCLVHRHRAGEFLETSSPGEADIPPERGRLGKALATLTNTPPSWRLVNGRS
jgi:hypothetical protein